MGSDGKPRLMPTPKISSADKARATQQGAPDEANVVPPSSGNVDTSGGCGQAQKMVDHRTMSSGSAGDGDRQAALEKQSADLARELARANEVSRAVRAGNASDTARDTASPPLCFWATAAFIATYAGADTLSNANVTVASYVPLLAIANGATRNGAASNGAASNGAASKGTANNGAARNGATSATSNGATLNGAASNGAASNGATLNGAALNGAALNDAASNGAWIVLPTRMDQAFMDTQVMGTPPQRGTFPEPGPGSGIAPQALAIDRAMNNIYDSMLTLAGLDKWSDLPKEFHVLAHGMLEQSLEARRAKAGTMQGGPAPTGSGTSAGCGLPGSGAQAAPAPKTAPGLGWLVMGRKLRQQQRLQPLQLQRWQGLCLRLMSPRRFPRRRRRLSWMMISRQIVQCDLASKKCVRVLSGLHVACIWA